MTAPPMTEVGRATMDGKSMKPTATAVKAGKSTTAMPATTPAAPTVKPSKPTAPAVKSTASAMATPATTPMPAAASTTPAGDCRSVRDNAKRANRNARCQNTYCFLLHGAFLNAI